MLVKIVGALWILGGLYFLWRPKAMLRKLQKKGVRYAKGALLGMGLVLGGSLVSFGFSHEGVLPKLLLVAGVIGIIRAFLMLKGSITVRIVATTLALPPWVLRVGAVVYIGVGVVIFLGGHRG